MVHPNDDNGDVLRRLEADGDDLSRPRDVDFNVVFPDEARAMDFARRFRRDGYSATVRFANVRETHPWEVLVVKNMIPTHIGITGFERELQDVADALGGYNDGWGCVAQSGKGLQQACRQGLIFGRETVGAAVSCDGTAQSNRCGRVVAYPDSYFVRWVRFQQGLKPHILLGPFRHD